MPRPFMPVHRVELFRPVGNPSDPDAEPASESAGTCRAERTDGSGTEIGPANARYFRQATVYTVPSRVRSDDGEIGMRPEPDWIIEDRGRGKRYRIVGVTQSDDLRYYQCHAEEVR